MDFSLFCRKIKWSLLLCFKVAALHAGESVCFDTAGIKEPPPCPRPRPRPPPTPGNLLFLSDEAANPAGQHEEFPVVSADGEMFLWERQGCVWVMTRLG